MKCAREFVTSTVLAGVFVIAPVYLAVLLLKAMRPVGGLARPVAALITDWLPAEGLLPLLLVMARLDTRGNPIRKITHRQVD